MFIYKGTCYKLKLCTHKTSTRGEAMPPANNSCSSVQSSV